jgi:NADH:ubiquinone oxidoreductase subunit 6 (subunit J)
VKTARLRPVPALLVATLFVGIAAVALETPALADTPAGIEGTTTDVIGDALFGGFLASFEIVAVLLVAALVGGIYLAKPEASRGEAVREAVDAKPRTETEKGGNDGTE